MNADYRSYKRFFQESWKELERDFRRRNVNPQQENDVVCYLWYALARKIQGTKGWPLHFIRTEDTRSIRNQRLRPDLNLNNRLFVEVKVWPLRKFRKGWKTRRRAIVYYVKKLEKYVREVKLSSSVRERIPVLAIWFWKDEKKREYPMEAKLIDDELKMKLEAERERYKNRVTIIYGPKKH